MEHLFRKQNPPRPPSSIFRAVNVLPDDSSPTDRTETREECSEQCAEKCDDQVIVYLFFCNVHFLYIMIILFINDNMY